MGIAKYHQTSLRSSYNFIPINNGLGLAEISQTSKVMLVVDTILMSSQGKLGETILREDPNIIVQEDGCADETCLFVAGNPIFFYVLISCGELV